MQQVPAARRCRCQNQGGVALLPRQGGHTLDVVRLRKHVQGDNLVQCISVLAQHLEVPGQSFGVAGNVGDLRRQQPQQALQRSRLAPGPGRVQHHGVGPFFQKPQHRLSLAQGQLHVVYVLDVFLGVGDGGAGLLDADDLVYVWREQCGERAHAHIGIHQQVALLQVQRLLDHLRHFRGLLHVYLEERRRRHPERTSGDGVLVSLLPGGQRDFRVGQTRLHQGVAGELPGPNGKLGGLAAPVLQLRQCGIDTVVHQHAPVNLHEPPRLPVYEAQLSLAPNGEPGMVAVTVLLGRRHDLGYIDTVEPAHALQGIDHLLMLDLKLALIVHVLPLAAGAPAVVRTRRLYPPRGRLQHFDHLRLGVAAVHPHHLGRHPFPGYTAKNEHVGLPGPRHGLTQPAPSVQRKFQQFTLGNGLLRQVVPQQNFP